MADKQKPPEQFQVKSPKSPKKGAIERRLGRTMGKNKNQVRPTQGPY